MLRDMLTMEWFWWYLGSYGNLKQSDCRKPKWCPAFSVFPFGFLPQMEVWFWSRQPRKRICSSSEKLACSDAVAEVTGQTGDTWYLPAWFVFERIMIYYSCPWFVICLLHSIRSEKLKARGTKNFEHFSNVDTTWMP